MLTSLDAVGAAFMSDACVVYRPRGMYCQRSRYEPLRRLLLFGQALLKSTLERGNIGREKFARWLRAITTILLARDKPSDRVKALGFVEQAVDVMKDVDEDTEVWSYVRRIQETSK